MNIYVLYIYLYYLKPHPPENCQLNVKNCEKKLDILKKLPKIFMFFKKNAKNVHFFNFVEKKTIFVNVFAKKCQVFGNFLTVKWQFSGGSETK